MAFPARLLRSESNRLTPRYGLGLDPVPAALCYNRLMQLDRCLEFRPTLCEVASLGWFIVCTFVDGRKAYFVEIFR